VAAVRCPTIDGSKKNQQQNSDGEFVHDITFQFKSHHANLVRLIGCCLETNVPRLVFEYISNGSLYNWLHGEDNLCRRLSLTKRLDIAIGSAEAVSYMHSNGDHNKHVHGDIKSANILLDDDLLPMVSDFGSSRLLSIDMYANAVPADRNYVDPAYVKTGRFTAKSDVYSFGVVLLELITRKTAIYDDNNSLSMNFVRCCKEEGNGRTMYDTDILMNGGDAQLSQVYIECLHKIGELAVRCLKDVDVDERRTMVEVVEELKAVKSMATKGVLHSEETG
jgi:serine/threonine protein kinase